MKKIVVCFVLLHAVVIIQTGKGTLWANTPTSHGSRNIPIHGNISKPPSSDMVGETRGKQYPHTWQQCLLRLDRYDPVLVELRKKIAGWQRSARYVGAWPNPSISYNREQLFPLQSQDSVGVQFTFPLGGSPRRQSEVATSQVHLLQKSLDMRLLQQRFVFLQAYFGLLYTKQTWQLEGDMLGHLRRLRQVVHARIKAGRLAEAQGLRWDLELQQRQIRWEAQQARWQQQGAELARQVGWHDGILVPQSALLPETPEPKRFHRSMAKLSNSPQVQYIRAQQALAQAQTKLAHAQAWPDLQVSLGYMYQHNSASAPTNSHGFFAGISLPLPSLDRNQYEISKARESHRLAAWREQFWLRKMQWEIPRLLQQWQGAYQRWQLYQVRVSQRLPALMRSAHAAFVGEGSVDSYLQAYQAVEQYHKADISLQRDIRMLSLQVYQRLGILPPQ